MLIVESVSAKSHPSLVSMTGASASFFENAWVAAIGRADQTHVTVRCFNGGTVSKTISFAGTIYGD